MNYLKHYNPHRTPQSQAIPGKDMARNNAGGYAFAIDDWKRLERFLIMGSEGGTYYVKENKLTLDNANAVQHCIAADGLRVVRRVVEISEAGRAPKNDPALFVLSMCMSADLADRATRRAAFAALPRVARIGTHLFSLAENRKAFGGWGRGFREAMAAWYNDMPPAKLAYQLVKYQRRGGWSHRDVLRKAHPTAPDFAHNTAYQWATRGELTQERGQDYRDLQLLYAFEMMRSAQTEREVIQIITDFGLPWEAVPAQWLKGAAVWEALLPRLPLTATIRNLGRLTANGLLAPMSAAVRQVVAKVTDAEYLRKSRVHPLSVLVALKTYQRGKGVRGKLTWLPVREIVDALDTAFYAAFGNVTTTGQRLMLALDVSASMAWQNIAGLPISPREAAAALALVTARVETEWVINAFADEFVPMNISPRQRLDDVVKLTNLPYGPTDCAIPMIYALKNNIAIDTFVIYTDSETWYGNIHPVQALQEYRRKMGIPAKLIVAGMVSNGFSIADPEDGGMLDIVGFDTATPNVMADFITEKVA